MDMLSVHVISCCFCFVSIILLSGEFFRSASSGINCFGCFRHASSPPGEFKNQLVKLYTKKILWEFLLELDCEFID